MNERTDSKEEDEEKMLSENHTHAHVYLRIPVYKTHTHKHENTHVTESVVERRIVSEPKQLQSPTVTWQTHPVAAIVFVYIYIHRTYVGTVTQQLYVILRTRVQRVFVIILYFILCIFYYHYYYYHHRRLRRCCYYHYFFVVVVVFYLFFFLQNFLNGTKRSKTIYD